ncbi:MAG: phosphodiesterase [Lachnospiraceae bacterium]|nr:phosphodiesterase [Lachnospiraceae bacterium]
MKWLIASDIHGSEFYCSRLIGAYRKEKAERLLLLGDLLYHGPRNDLPEGYAPKKVTEMLNSLKNEILCVRGNCEAEVDQMVLEFPVMADYALIPFGKRVIFATHGHIFNKDRLPALKPGDILLYGHTHVTLLMTVGLPGSVPGDTDSEGIICMNPGSVSIPKESSAHGYMIFMTGEDMPQDRDMANEPDILQDRNMSSDGEKDCEPLIGPHEGLFLWKNLDGTVYDRYIVQDLREVN